MNWKTFDFNKWSKEDAIFDHDGFEAEVEELMEKACEQKDITILTQVKHPRPPWIPHVFHNEEGKQTEVYLSDEAYYVKWLTPEITLFLSCDTNEIVGMEIADARSARSDG